MAIETAFGSAGLSDYDLSGNKVRVPALMKATYLAAIAEAGATPESPTEIIPNAINNTPSIMASSLQRETLIASKAKMLSQMITDFSWVSKAAVLYSEEKLPGISGKKRVGATVTVQPNVGEEIDSHRVRILQKLVSGWNPSLTPENVAIIDQTDGSTLGSRAGENAEQFEDRYHRTLVAYENNLRRRVERHLSFIPGVRVQVSAVLNERVASETYSNEPTEKSIISETETVNIEENRSVTGPAGPPGLQQQSANRNGDENQGRTTTTRNTDKSENSRDAKGIRRTVEQLAGLIPKEVQASIEVPRDYVLEALKKDKLRETGEIPEQFTPQELSNKEERIRGDIENSIVRMLPDPSRDEYEFVHVGFFDTVPGPEIPPPSIANEALFFAQQHASTAGMVLLGLFGLLMLRSVVNGGGKGDDPLPALQIQTPDGEVVTTGGGEEEDEESGPKLTLKKPESLKDDLAQIVREDPDGAAAILRSWIGNAS